MEIEGINFLFSVGGDNKANSSSWILKNWEYNSEERVWGKFYNLFQDGSELKVKELIVEAGKGMSFQKHFYRNEIWFVSSGRCEINHSLKDQKKKKTILNKYDQFFVPKESWHQITNPFDEVCKLSRSSMVKNLRG